MRLIFKHSVMMGTNSGLKENIRRKARSINKRQWQTKVPPQNTPREESQDHIQLL